MSSQSDNDISGELVFLITENQFPQSSEVTNDGFGLEPPNISNFLDDSDFYPITPDGSTDFKRMKIFSSLEENIPDTISVSKDQFNGFLAGYHLLSKNSGQLVLIPKTKWNDLTLCEKFHLYLKYNNHIFFFKEEERVLWDNSYLLTITDETIILDILAKKHNWQYLLRRGIAFCGFTEIIIIII